MIPIFFLRITLQMQIPRSDDNEFTNRYESPELVTCGWNYLSELTPLHSLKSNPPVSSCKHCLTPSPSYTKFFPKNHNYKPKETGKENHLKSQLYFDSGSFIELRTQALRKR